ncbi:MAG: hypothetical protein R2697_19420 [Ilumatobacteraceae bacterium]
MDDGNGGLDDRRVRHGLDRDVAATPPDHGLHGRGPLVRLGDWSPGDLSTGARDRARVGTAGGVTGRRLALELLLLASGLLR